MRTTIDRAGRVVIPKTLRDQAGLQPGASVEVELRDGRLEIEPVRPEVIVERRGRWTVLVAPSDTPPLTAEQVRAEIEALRAERGAI